MEIKKIETNTEIGSRVKFYVAVEDTEVARAFLYVLQNQLH